MSIDTPQGRAAEADAKAEAVMGAAGGDAGKGDTPDDSVKWIAMARDAYTESTDWFDASLRQTIEKAMAHFANRHPPGSKYHSDSYKFRSKGFRPKTRSTIRRNEAAADVAFFSTKDLVYISAENDSDESQRATAAVLGELMNYRLDDTIPWFLTLIGAYQDAMNTGVCISFQGWEYDEDARELPIPDLQGNPLLDTQGNPTTRKVVTVLDDKPVIDLIPLENFRISPAANWADPIRTTPYIVHLIPMFIGDIQAKMQTESNPGGKWHFYPEGTIKAAAATQYDSIRAARDGKKRADDKDLSHVTGSFDTAWVHRNIVRFDGDDLIFYTLGTEHLLSDPKPLMEEYKHLQRGERPYVMGSVLIETHKVYKSGVNELLFGLQESANEIQNQRQDNVKLAMNKRYYARRGANIDYKSLTRSVAGSVTLMDDINEDVKAERTPDVTGSAYQEQDRVSLDFDELAGTFSPGSVQSNRKLGETVGGMEMLSGDANTITEYQLRVFAATWVEPVMKQMVRMEQAYETDEIILAVAGQKAKLEQKFGIDQVTDEMLQGMVTVRVNVGFGATNPEKRIQKLATGLGAVATYLPNTMQRLNEKEVVSEVFGALGYKDGAKFFAGIDGDNEDPRIKQMQGMIQQLTQTLQFGQVQEEGKKAVAQIAADGRVHVETVRQQGAAALAQLESDENVKDRMLQQWITQVDAHLEAAKIAGQNDLGLKGLKVILAQEVMRLNAQRNERHAKLLGIPDFEPIQHAPAGQAMEQ